MTISPVRYEVLAPPEPRRGTLLDAAQVDDGARGPRDAVQGMYDSFNCMTFRSYADWCAQTAKDFDNAPQWIDGLWFAAYGGAVCGAVGMDQDRWRTEIGRVFDMGESTAVEQALLEFRFAENLAGGALPGEWAEPTDITPAAGAVSPRVGAAMLEGDVSKNYVGRPTLHMPVTIASLMSQIGATEWDGNVLRTKLGSKIAAGAGYEDSTGPDGVAAAAGEKWLYGTGEVKVHKGTLIQKEAFGISDNAVFMLAERAYVATVDCYTAAIRVTVTA